MSTSDNNSNNNNPRVISQGVNRLVSTLLIQSLRPSQLFWIGEPVVCHRLWYRGNRLPLQQPVCYITFLGRHRILTA